MNHLHPFPARMAPQIAMRALPKGGRPIRVLDPMMGSGTSLITARRLGHEAVGIDRDPLALLIASASTKDLDGELLTREGTRLLVNARERYRGILAGEAYPINADEETREFVRYWFDLLSRRQLAALTHEIAEGSYKLKRFLQLAVSRLIIAKQGSVSRAIDISHSRPHIRRNGAPRVPRRPFMVFPQSIEAIVSNTQFRGQTGLPRATTLLGDCRSLPFSDEEFDVIITSPPYLNAIDYLRGHKLSLVWLGYSVKHLRNVRATNVGSDRGIEDTQNDDIIDDMVDRVDRMSTKLQSTLRRYVKDLRNSLNEMRRVIRNGGEAILVIGDCTIRGIEVRNSRAIDKLAAELGFERFYRRKRKLPPNKRYLPPPSKHSSRQRLQKRMRDEIVLKFRAA